MYHVFSQVSEPALPVQLAVVSLHFHLLLWTIAHFSVTKREDGGSSNAAFSNLLELLKHCQVDLMNPLSCWANIPWFGSMAEGKIDLIKPKFWHCISPAEAVSGSRAGSLSGFPEWLPWKVLAVWLQGCSAVRLPVFPEWWAAVLPGSLSHRSLAVCLPSGLIAQTSQLPVSSAAFADCWAGQEAAGLWSEGSRAACPTASPHGETAGLGRQTSHAQPCRHGQCLHAKHQSWQRKRNGFAFSS